MEENANNFLKNATVDLNIKKKKAYELVFEKLEDSILSGDIKPGEKIPTERELAKIFNVSRNTVRTALKLLEFTELIAIKHGVGIIVSEDVDKTEDMIEEQKLLKSVQADPFQALLEVREIISPAVAGLAAKRATEDDLDILRRDIDVMESSLKNGKYMLDDVYPFHTHLYLASKNVFFYKSGKYFEKLIKDAKIMSINVEEKAPEVFEYIKDIFYAVEKHDEENARKMMERYLDNLKTIHSE